MRGHCECRVGWSPEATCCDGCDTWYHKSYLSICTEEFKDLEYDSMVWLCCKCDSKNYVQSFYHSFELQLNNSFEPLQDTHHHDIAVHW